MSQEEPMENLFIGNELGLVLVGLEFELAQLFRPPLLGRCRIKHHLKSGGGISRTCL